MIWKGLFKLIWKGLFKRGHDPETAAMVDDACAKARRHFLEQQLRAMAPLSGIPGADEFQDNPESMLAVELPFMWGWHHAYAQAAGNWQTTPSMRASIHMIEYLMKHHGFDFQRARAETSALDALWNEADPLFDAIRRRGEESYANPESPLLGMVMLVLITDRDTLRGKINKLDWSSDPGAHEAHLIRRHDNPYFPASRRSVSKEDLAEAKRLDNDDYIACRQRFEELGKEFEALPPTVTSGELLKFRERLEDLTRFAMGVGGPAKEIASAADKIRDAVIKDLRAGFSDDNEMLENIEKADLFHNDFVRKFNIPVLAQMSRENSPINKDENIFTMLSEDPETISICINIMSEDARAIILVDALRIMREALDDGYIDPQFEEKLAALEGRWHWTPPKPSDADL